MSKNSNINTYDQPKTYSQEIYDSVVEFKKIPLLLVDRKLFAQWTQSQNTFELAKKDLAAYGQGLDRIFDAEPTEKKNCRILYADAFKQLNLHNNPSPLYEFLDQHPQVHQYIKQELPSLQAASDKWITEDFLAYRSQVTAIQPPVTSNFSPKSPHELFARPDPKATRVATHLRTVVKQHSSAFLEDIATYPSLANGIINHSDHRNTYKKGGYYYNQLQKIIKNLSQLTEEQRNDYINAVNALFEDSKPLAQFLTQHPAICTAFANEPMLIDKFSTKYLEASIELQSALSAAEKKAANTTSDAVTIESPLSSPIGNAEIQTVLSSFNYREERERILSLISGTRLAVNEDEKVLSDKFKTLSQEEANALVEAIDSFSDTKRPFAIILQKNNTLCRALLDYKSKAKTIVSDAKITGIVMAPQEKGNAHHF